ncbi:hypothetical protein [Neptuniibacter sp. QD57_21]|uniref:hypothetical protein n=1 Tax=Neptuniibacter sp. QD57_21 TaxID=3398213 RepID=UPI0039F51533
MYTFKNTEINNKKASDFETKSLLYLLGMRKDSDEIETVAVDCFNDVTGLNSDFSKLWDVQSKNHSYLPPSKIGESLYTLYDNFVSSIEFYDYVLFIPKLDRGYLVDDKKNIYGYSNIKGKQKKGIEKSLLNKINKNDSGDVPPLFCDFLSKVVFVEDNKKISTYIKRISGFKNKKAVSEKIYEGIFREIRDFQSSLKNSYIENETIKKPSEVIKFNRHITKVDINTLLISRLVGTDVFSFPGVPFDFYPVVKDFDLEDIKDLVQECNENLSRAFFDKNGCKEFWKVTENIIYLIKKNPGGDVFYIYDCLCSMVKVKNEYLEKDTLLYMISLVKTGMNNAN